MFEAIHYIPANAPICYHMDDGFIYFKYCDCPQPVGFTKRETFPGQPVEFHIRPI